MSDVEERLAELWARSSGAEFARALGDGQVPVSPVMEHVNLRITGAERGRVDMEWVPPERICNRAGIVHGGYLSIVLDDAAGIACATLGERFMPSLTMHLHIEFIRPVYPHVRHVAVGEVIKEGRTRIIADGRVEDPDGRLVARASGSFVPNRKFLEGPPSFTHTS